MPQDEDRPIRRRRRSSAEIARLKALRQAHAEKLERVRQDEQRIDNALAPFAEAAEAIAAAERRHEDRCARITARLERDLADLDRAREKAIEEAAVERRALKTALDDETGKLRAVMGESVKTIREVGTGMPETAALLGVSVGEARRLAVAAKRLAREASSTGSSADGGVPETPPSESAPVLGRGADAVTDAEQREPDAAPEGEREKKWGGASA
ncbi:hypothetical protein ACFXI3_30130 [Amycolatopsis sp. NPDC059235]|uniref:hypothetical protein n=2 Tax=unclassified Amycolatopsis TaxID=2618356 RepID=UPI00366EBEAF